MKLLWRIFFYFIRSKLRVTQVKNLNGDFKYFLAVARDADVDIEELCEYVKDDIPLNCEVILCNYVEGIKFL